MFFVTLGISKFLTRNPCLGMTWSNRFDEFSENFQTASDPPPPIFGKKCCAFVREIGARSAFPLPKKRNIMFRIGNDPPPHSEVFRKFIEFGPGRSPLEWKLHSLESVLKFLRGSF